MHITINSLSVHDLGEKDKQPIILIHGFPFDYTMWTSQIRALQKNYRVIAYDIRGLGKSYVGDGQYTMEFFVDDLFSLVHEMQLEKPVLCGLSMGGYVALRAVERDQSRFNGLMLLDTKSDNDDDAGKVKRSEGINKINTDGLDKFVDDLIPNLFAEESLKNMKATVENITTVSKSHSPLGVKGSLLAMACRTNTTKFLKKINIPTLVMGGSFDKLTPPTTMRDMADKIKDSEFAIVPRAGHLAPVENPSYVNDMLCGFMKRRVMKKK
jgi:pimeloyl-ACP methyl ester carboxylesterase